MPYLSYTVQCFSIDSIHYTLVFENVRTIVSRQVMKKILEAYW